MISIVKKARSKSLYIQFYIGGKCIQRSTKLEDTSENRVFIKKKIIPELERKISNGEFDTKKQSRDFNFFCEKYLNQKVSLKSYREWYNIVNNQLLPIFNKRDIASIKRYEIKEFIEDKLKTISSKRARTILNVIGAIFDIAIDYEIISINPSNAIKLPTHTKEEIEPFTQDEVNLLLTTSEGWFKNYLAFAFYTGARPGELLALLWSDIDLENGTISISRRIKKGVVDTPKTKSSIREVPIFEPLIPFIKDQMKNARHMSVFVNPNTNNTFLSTERLTAPWKNLLVKCKLPYKILYSTRHTFITTMLKESTLSMFNIAQIVGHSNTEMIVRNYAKFIASEHLKVDRSINIFTDKITDSKVKMS